MRLFGKHKETTKDETETPEQAEVRRYREEQRKRAMGIASPSGPGSNQSMGSGNVAMDGGPQAGLPGQIASTFDFQCKGCAKKFHESWKKCPKCGGDIVPIGLDRLERLDIPGNPRSLPRVGPPQVGQPGRYQQQPPGRYPQQAQGRYPQQPPGVHPQQVQARYPQRPPGVVTKKVKKVKKASNAPVRNRTPSRTGNRNTPRSRTSSTGRMQNPRRAGMRKTQQTKAAGPSDKQRVRPSDTSSRKIPSPISREPVSKRRMPARDTNLDDLFNYDPALDSDDLTTEVELTKLDTSDPSRDPHVSEEYRKAPAEVRQMLDALVGNELEPFKEIDTHRVVSCPNCGFQPPPGDWDFCMKCGYRF